MTHGLKLQKRIFFSPLVSILWLLILLSPSYADDNMTGIWQGSVIIGENFSDDVKNQLKGLYFSIHQTEDELVLVMLSAAEATGDLFASTYVGVGRLAEDSTVNVLSAYTDKAYFPTYDFINRSLAYVENPYRLWLRPFDNGQSAELVRDSGTANLGSFVLLKKVF